MPSPYDSLPPSAYWRPAISDRNPLELAEIYRRKFAISAEDRVACAGSCFAQHVGRRLRQGGFTYVDIEPPPPMLPASEHGKFGYGLYSARFGNIYTARQLFQLFERAYGRFQPSDAIWETNGRFHDAFRPTIEPAGFASAEELVALREAHLRRTRALFETVDVFVFTLGLTEAWVSRVDGAVYPMCPGTAAGIFDESRYEFVNFGFADILGDMDALIAAWRAINPGVRFILTVSPVPLTATASGEHVLVATSYSKSVLRAVAGELSRRDHVDYFPSFELISAPSQRGIFFAPNMRSVSETGVSYAMGYFFDQHRLSGASAPPGLSAATGMTDDDVICDEILLDPELT